MSYAVKEIIYTLQGEGGQAGRPAVFCRFTGCNLWSGHEADRGDALCPFCDTDFVGTDGPGGGVFAGPEELAGAVASRWNQPPQNAASTHLPDKAVSEKAPPAPTPLVVFTGGEPLLQLDQQLVEAVHARGFQVAIETNGTRVPPAGVDWICVSPKAGVALRIKSGQELKLVFPQDGAPPEQYAALAFERFYLQPMDGPNLKQNMQLAVEYCLRHPQWHLSVQRQKLLGIP